jgi:signal transduction histidine kinase
MKDDNFKLYQTRESLEFALDSGKMSTWDLDLKTNQLKCSKEMLALWGIELHEFKNQRDILQSKVHPEDLDKMNFAINNAIKNRSVYELEYRIIPRRDEIRWVLSRGRCTFALNSDEPIRLAGIVYDITEKKAKEIELVNAQKARSDFLTIAGHELKTPLACLQLQLKVMEWQLKDIPLQGPLTDVLTNSLKKQNNHLSRMTRIVENILDETKISEGLFSLQVESCELTEMVSSVIEHVSLIAESNGIEIKYDRKMSIHGNWDRFRLEQVLLNLLMNAIKYGNKKPIHVEVSKENDHALMIVRDEGPGISSTDQSRIFQRFERVSHDKSLSGMGLGLYISHYIIQAHGGEIRLKSKLGFGSEFIVAIPVS